MNTNDLEGLDLSNITLEDLKNLIKSKEPISNNDYDILISTDGASRFNNFGCGTFAIWKDNKPLLVETKFYGTITNNLSEMITIKNSIIFLLLSEHNTKQNTIKLISDSELCVNLINGKYNGKNLDLVLELEKINKLIKELNCNLIIEHKPRGTREISFCDKLNNFFLDKS